MCTWAGYIGQERAAAVLLQMAKRQEGLWSGYYSGLVTVDRGRLHWEKVVGDFAKLVAETNAAELPGTLGLVHSRTNSGGDVEWGQPFVDAECTVAGMGQGSGGVFADDSRRVALGNALLAQGRTFRSATAHKVGGYPIIADGSAIHTSELLTVAAAAEYETCRDPGDAARRAVRQAPSEAVWAFVFADQPDTIVVTNVNQRVVVGRDDSGTYIASSALAIPAGVRWRCEMPGNTLAVISREEARFELLAPAEELPVDETLPVGLENAALDYVRSNPGASLPQIAGSALNPLLPKDGLTRRGFAAYRTIERLLQSGMVRAETKHVPGANREGTAPLTVFFAAEVNMQGGSPDETEC